MPVIIAMILLWVSIFNQHSHNVGAFIMLIIGGNHMTHNLSEFQKRLCLNCENRSKEVTDRVFCIYPGECPKIKEIAEKNKRERNND